MHQVRGLAQCSLFFQRVERVFAEWLFVQQKLRGADARIGMEPVLDDVVVQ